MVRSNCKKCAECKKHTVRRYDRKGNEIKYTYCQKQEEVHQLSNWLFITGGYLRSTNYIEGKLEYFHSFFKDDKSKEIDHIDGDKTNNCLDNLYECSRVQNTQNRHDKEGFHNVKANSNGTYTSYKITNGQYHIIATENTDIEAYDKFVKYCRNNGIGINPNTFSWQTYSAVKNQIPYINGGICG